jgi:hypothetical protein
MKEIFIGEALTPEDMSFSVSPMAMGTPGLPQKFSWKGRRFSLIEVLEEWKESGPCRHGSGERYVRKHWFRVRTTEDLEMKIYFERQARSRGGSRWRLYSIRNTEPSYELVGATDSRLLTERRVGSNVGAQFQLPIPDPAQA